MGVSFRSHRRSSSLGGSDKIFLTLFSLAFMAFGVFFLYLTSSEILENADSKSWQETSCRIGVSKIVENGSNYEYRVRYRYDYNGREYKGKRYTFSELRSSDYSDLQRVVDRYPAGETVRCLVNPKDPTKAVLERDQSGFLLKILGPMVFILIGAGVLYGAWFWRGGQKKRRSISERATGNSGDTVVKLVCGAFVLIGVIGGYFLLVKPIGKLFDAQGWRQERCAVVSSRVRSHSGDDGTTYSVDILYEYTIGGKTFKSNRYNFIGGSSSGRQSKQQIVDAHPPGTIVPCYVNPDELTDAVLSREFSAIYLIGLFPLLFLVAGLGFYRLYNKQKTKKQARSIDIGGGSMSFAESGVAQPSFSTSAAPDITWLPDANEKYAENLGGSYLLKPQISPRGKLIAMTVAALFVNTIVGVIGYHSLEDTFVMLFMIPFALAAVATWIGVGYFFLGLRNPVPKIIVSSLTPALGESLSVTWEIVGDTKRIQRLQLLLEGRESATYRRGTRSVTSKNTFRTIELVNLVGEFQAQSGTATVEIPSDTMHTFHGGNNRIEWELQVKGEIPKWPDVLEAYSIVIRPQVPQEQRHGF